MTGFEFYSPENRGALLSVLMIILVNQIRRPQNPTYQDACLGLNFHALDSLSPEDLYSEGDCNNLLRVSAETE